MKKRRRFLGVSGAFRLNYSAFNVLFTVLNALVFLREHCKPERMNRHNLVNSRRYFLGN